MSEIRRAAEADIVSLVWMARKSHPYGPYASFQFRVEAARSEFAFALNHPQRLVLVAVHDDIVGFAYCKHHRPRFVRESVVELCDVWLEPNRDPHNALVPKLWAAISTWGNKLRAAHVVWNCDFAHIPFQTTKTLNKMGIKQVEMQCNFAALTD